MTVQELINILENVNIKSVEVTAQDCSKSDVEYTIGFVKILTNRVILQPNDVYCQSKVIKNERHSYAAKMLAKTIELYKVYQSNLATAKYNLRVSRYDLYKRYLVRDYQIEIEDCRHMINKFQKEIKEWKEEIYIAQKEFSHGGKNSNS